MTTRRDSRWLAAGPATVALIAALAGAVTFGGNVFSASVSDTSGYVAAASGLVDGNLVRPSPLQLVPAIHQSAATTSPLAFVPGPESGTEVPVYPLGMSYLMAAAAHPFGTSGVYAVAPLCFALLIVLAYRLAADAAGAAAGVAAAAAVTVNPAAILNAVWSMSDLSAAVCWIATWFFTLRQSRSGAVAAGLLSALAMTIRPVLGPLTVVFAVQCLVSQKQLRSPYSWSWDRASIYTMTAATGPLLVAWSQAVLYGSPLRSGYPGAEAYFSTADVFSNASSYAGLYVSTHGPVFGVAAVVSALVLVLSGTESGRLARTGLPIILVNYGIYLFYMPFHSWPFLRFFLPATTVLAVLAAAGVAHAGAITARKWPRILSWTSLFALALSPVAHSGAEYRVAAGESFSHAKIPSMGRYLDVVLPQNAVVVSYIHSGAVAHYTGRRTLGPERLTDRMLDDAVDHLREFGYYPVLLLDENVEVPAFKRLFAGSSYGALDWPTRAEAHSDTRILLYDFADRARHMNGARWPTDIIRIHPGDGWLRYGSGLQKP